MITAMTKRSQQFKKKQRKDQAGEKATVVAMHAGDVFECELEDGTTIKARRAGKMRQNKINVLVGDSVRVEVDPYGGNATSRIVFRL